MIERIRSILDELTDVDGWKITETSTESSELFFIKQELDMNRGKKVSHFQVTVYVDFTDQGEKYRGSSTASIHPTMNDDEIRRACQDAQFAASYVKNRYYPLVDPADPVKRELKSSLADAPLAELAARITDSIYQADIYNEGWINSAELFLNKKSRRILNSRGVDVSYQSYQGELEFITNWKGAGEEIELYKKIDFADFNAEDITGKVREMLKLSKEKAEAEPTPALNKHTVLLTGEPVKEFFKYYYHQANAQQVFEQISTAEVGRSIQGKDIQGDMIQLELDPFIPTSTASALYDQDGLALHPVNIINDGVLERYWGDRRYSHYLEIEPTGNIQNFVISGGINRIDTLKQEPYLELLAFSDFQLDILTGNFAGEIRLGRYYDGNKVIPVTGGSISGNIREAQQQMYLSKETQSLNNFIGPRTIKLLNVSVAGS